MLSCLQLADEELGGKIDLLIGTGDLCQFWAADVGKKADIQSGLTANTASASMVYHAVNHL